MFRRLEKFLSDEYNNLVLWCPIALIAGVLLFEELQIYGSDFSLYLIVIFGIASIFLFLLYKFYGSQLLSLCFFGIILIFLYIGIITASLHKAFSVELADISVFDTFVIGKVYNIKPSSNGGASIYIDIDLVDGADINTHSKVQIRTPYKNVQDIMVGDTIMVDVQKLEKPTYRIFPQGYDAERQARYENIEAVGVSFKTPTKINTNNKFNFFEYIHKIRKFIYNKFLSNMEKEPANFAAAIILGEQKGMKQNLIQNMRYAGISHILCVSGLHLSLVAMISFLTFRFLLNLSDFIAFNFNIKKIASILALGSSFIYWCISGMQIAATRAFIMTSIVMISILFGKIPDPMRSLGFAAATMTILNPKDVLHPSFQLSFTAVAALIAGYELYTKYKIYLGSSSGLFSRFKTYVLANVYTSILASVATAPVVIYYFFFFSNGIIP